MAITFDEGDIKEFRDCFFMYTRGKDITSEEQLTMMMRSVAFSPTLSEVKKFFAEHNKGNKIDFATFVLILEKQSKIEKCQKDIIEAFQAHDKTGSGFVPTSELKHILTQFGDKLSETEVNKLFKEAGIQGAQAKYEDIIRSVLTPLPDI